MKLCATTLWITRLRPSLMIALLTASATVGAMAPVAAQSIATASIEGTVSDTSGGALPGVAVTLTSPALQVPQMTDVTNIEGHYRFTQLPVGVYQIKYELSGFQATMREGLGLSSGFAAKVDMVLKLATWRKPLQSRPPARSSTSRRPRQEPRSRPTR